MDHIEVTPESQTLQSRSNLLAKSADDIIAVTGSLIKEAKARFSIYAPKSNPQESSHKEENSSPEKRFIQGLQQLEQELTEKEIMLSLVGEMSGGKSTIANTLIGYPLLPMAKIPTSETPVEIHYGSSLRLEVCTFSDLNTKHITQTKVYTLTDPAQCSTEQKLDIIRYIKQIQSSSILSCENINYYYPFAEMQPEEILTKLDRMETMMQLMLVVLSASVGRGNPDFSSSPLFSSAIKAQTELLRSIFGILEPDRPYMVRIWVDCDLLKNGLVLLDLPGLGSGNPEHTKVTLSYLERSHAYILPFTPTIRTDAAKEALKKIMSFENILNSPSKDARFILVVNQCDQATDPSAIASAVSQIRPAIHDNIHVTEIIPISARYAEQRLVDRGVDPMDTMTAKTMCKLFPFSREQIIDMIHKNYDQEFQYTDPDTQQTVCYSTRRFMEKTIGQYAPRIRFLCACQKIQALCREYQNFCNDLNVQLALIRILHLCGDNLMQELLSSMEKTAKECQVELVNQLENIKLDIHSNAEVLAKKTQQAKVAITTQLQLADNTMKTHLHQEVGKMSRDAFGHVVVDPNVINPDLAEKNQLIYEDLTHYFEIFDLLPYMASGQDMLKCALAEERDLYQSGVSKIAQVLHDFLGSCEQSMDRVYHDFEVKYSERTDQTTGEAAPSEQVQKLSPATLKIYLDCFDHAKKAILIYLQDMTTHLLPQIADESELEEEISHTAAQVAGVLNLVEDYYHKTCSGYMKEMIKSTRFLKRSYIDIDTIQQQICTNFRDPNDNLQILGTLDTILCKNLAGLNDPPHTVRLQHILDKSFARFAQLLVTQIGKYMKDITDEVRDQFFHGRVKLTSQLELLKTRAQDSREQQILYGDNPLIQSALEAGSNFSFSREEVSKTHERIRTTIDAFSATIEDICKLQETILQEEKSMQSKTDDKETPPAEDCPKPDQEAHEDGPHPQEPSVPDEDPVPEEAEIKEEAEVL